MLEGIVSESVFPGRQKDDSLNRLQKTCGEFESIFLAYVLKSMRNTIGKGDLLGNSHEGKIYQSMFDENLAAVIAKSGGIGLGKMLFERLKEMPIKR